VTDKDEVMLVTNGGMLIRMKAKEISVIGRNTQGVRLIALESAEEKVTGISKLPESEEEEGEEGGGGTLVAEASASSESTESGAEAPGAGESTESGSSEPGTEES
jgi:DNA gyrase subunit A